MSWEVRRNIEALREADRFGPSKINADQLGQVANDLEAFHAALKLIKGAEFPGASTLAAHGNWEAYAAHLMAIAERALVGREI